jgi:hypothetical protein
VRSTTTFAHAAIGRIGRPAFPAPSLGETIMHNSGLAPRERRHMLETTYRDAENWVAYNMK